MHHKRKSNVAAFKFDVSLPSLGGLVCATVVDVLNLREGLRPWFQLMSI